MTLTITIEWGGVSVRTTPSYLRLGDVHTAPDGRSMFVFEINGHCATMRPLEARGPSEHVSAPVVTVARQWPRTCDCGGTLVWIEPQAVHV